MIQVSSRELRNNTRALLDRVGVGEEITITVDGRPIALLQTLARRPRWLPRDEFVRRALIHQADPGLITELASLSPETTDLPNP